MPTQPLLYLHGRNDGCIGVEVAESCAASMVPANVTVEIVDGAGHFLQLERPDVVNARILEFLGMTAAERPRRCPTGWWCS